MRTEQTPDADLLLRPGTVDDLAAVAEIHLAARRAAVPLMPPTVQPDAEVREWVAGWDLAHHLLWVAEDPADPGEYGLDGYAVIEEDWLHSLYVDPARQGRGVGSALLDVVKAVRPDGFALWVFESNTPARRFYAERGLVELEHTDGSTNMERSADLRMAWLGADPLSFLRHQIDGVDDELALVLARRAALTAAVQRFKGVPGHAGRDRSRETEIAARMGARAPGLGAAGMSRIMDAVITATLDLLETDGPDGPSGESR